MCNNKSQIESRTIFLSLFTLYNKIRVCKDCNLLLYFLDFKITLQNHLKKINLKRREKRCENVKVVQIIENLIKKTYMCFGCEFNLNMHFSLRIIYNNFFI